MDTTPGSPRLPTRVGAAASSRRARLSWRGCRKVAFGTLRESTTDRVSLAAAGCGFYATLSLFPAISMLISVYGLAFNAHAVEQQLEVCGICCRRRLSR